jgi:glycosyltransferase involved in cell wall biosynthesis
MTVGFHAPLPPIRSGVADYAARLLRELRKRGRVQVGAVHADVQFYHLGNNQLHRAIYELAIEKPGVVVLHDAVLQHFYLGAFDQARYVEEYCYNYGEWERSFAGDLYRERAGSGMDHRFFRRPMLKRVAERSLAVVVHNPAAAAAVREHSTNANVIEIPHFFDDVGQAFSVPGTNFTFGVFGFLRESKRILPILKAFDKLHRIRPDRNLLVAGEFASKDLERAVQPWLKHPAIIRRGHLKDREFWQAANAVDCCLNLRAPAVGETSGIGIRMMGLGKTVFFTDGREIESLPPDTCIRISPGPSEGAELFEYMKIVVDLPQYARAMGTRAAAHIRRVHSVERIADLYWNVLCEVYTASSSSLPS